MATTTPNYGWEVPENLDPDNVPKDMLTLALPIDAVVKQLEDRVNARDELIVSTDGAGNFFITNGLGEEVPVTTDGDGNWSVMQ